MSPIFPQFTLLFLFLLSTYSSFFTTLSGRDIGVVGGGGSIVLYCKHQIIYGFSHIFGFWISHIFQKPKPEALVSGFGD